MTRTIIPVPRRLVTPQGGWWTGAGSMFFDGVADRVVVSNPLSGTSPWTLICSRLFPKDPVALTASMSFGTFAAGQLIYAGLYNTAGKRVISGGYRLACEPDTGVTPDWARWHRIGVTYSGGAGGTVTVYRDLVAIGSLAYVGSPNITGALGYLGTLHLATFSRGWMHDARVYDRALSPLEVAADYRGEWVDPTGLVRHWPLEAKVGATTHERVGNTMDAVTGAIIDANVVPWRARTASPARTVSPARSAA